MNKIQYLCLTTLVLFILFVMFTLFYQHTQIISLGDQIGYCNFRLSKL